MYIYIYIYIYIYMYICIYVYVPKEIQRKENYVSSIGTYALL